ncbi:MAG TPA: T9SS type A sorting domain-containing protein [Saprospiraceae bacterium]|nr:T9SS type A sorting domain-containing protein [Saprospiraceae bacterium]
MKKQFLLTLFSCVSLSIVYGQVLSKGNKNIFNSQQRSARSAFIYTLTTLNEPYTNLTGAISVNNGEIWDDPDYTVPVSFPFYILDTEITYLQMGGAGGGGASFSSPTEDPDVMVIVFPFETDLVDRGYNDDIESLSPISYKVEGAAGNHILKVEFKNAGSYNDDDLEMFINFQIWLYENNNRVEFHYGPNFINDPALFYDDLPGAYAGLAAYNEDEDLIIEPHFLAGSASNPNLSTDLNPINGTPANGTVYRLSLDEPLVVTVTGEDGTSFCDPNGSAEASVTGGLLPYSYHWNTGSTESIITNLDAGTYTVTVTDANSTTATGSVSILNTYEIIVDASATDETGVNANDGTAMALPTGGLVPYSFEWSNGSAAFMIVDLAPGIYTVTITDDAGCTASQSVAVNAFGCPTLSIGAFVVNPECFGICNGVIQIQAVGNGTPPYSYFWSNGTVSSGLTGLCAGDFSVTVVDDNGCSVSETYVLTEPSQIVPGALSSAETAPGANDGSAWASPSGGVGAYTYLWSNSSTDSLITGLVPGIYTVTVSDANGCSASQAVAVSMFGCTILDGSVTNATCFESCDGSITVTLNNAVLPVTFLWDDGSTQSSLTEACAGSYSVTATDATGCSASASFTVDQPFPVNANADNTDETLADANDGTAWSTPNGGTAPYTYLWSNGSVDSLIINLAPGIYFVTVTDANGCTDVDIANISQVQCIGSHTFIHGEPTCHGSCDGYAIAFVDDTISVITYLWNTGDTTNSLTGLCDGTYSLTITNEDKGCTDDSFTFELHSPDSLELIVDQITHLTDSTSASISIHGAGGIFPYTYQWSGPGGFTSDLEDLSGIGPGTYIVEMVDDFGCSVIDTITIEDHTVGIYDPDNLKIRLYPNPASEVIYIDAYGLADFKVQLYSIDGHVLHSWKNITTIDINGFVPGIYAIRITQGQEYFTSRLVIIR